MRYVTSDIHGCYDALIELLQFIHFSEQDFLYIIGDAIDRGPESMKTLKKIMSMKNVELLMGNHEEFLLEGLKEELEGTAGYVKKELWLKHGGDSTYQQFKSLEKEEQKEIIDYLKYRPLYKILGNIVLVHGGIETENISYHSWEELMKQQKREILLWTKDEFLSKPMKVSLEGMVIFGHTPTVEIRRIRGEEKTKGVIWKEKNRWGIDGGYLFGGRINCIRLEDWKEFYIEAK